MSSLRQILVPGLLSFSLFVSFGCKKHSASPVVESNGSYTGALTGTILLSQAKVQLGQPLIATLKPNYVTPFRWTCSFIAGMSHVTSADRMAMYIFEQPGVYTVQAASLGVDSVSVTDSSWIQVRVSDTVYQPVGPAQDTLSLAGDQVSLTPTLDSAANLILLAQTKNTYGCLPSLVYSITTGSDGTGGIFINLQEVQSNGPSNCHAAENPASAYLFCPSPTSQWAPGDYPLSVLLNGVTYTGTLTITADGYSFSWNYTSGVTITNTQLKK
jgi:hypothetical protein